MIIKKMLVNARLNVCEFSLFTDVFLPVDSDGNIFHVYTSEYLLIIHW